jgi:hypothetical protein
MKYLYDACWIGEQTRPIYFQALKNSSRLNFWDLKKYQLEKWVHFFIHNLAALLLFSNQKPYPLGHNFPSTINSALSAMMLTARKIKIVDHWGCVSLRCQNCLLHGTSTTWIQKTHIVWKLEKVTVVKILMMTCANCSTCYLFCGWQSSNMQFKDDLPWDSQDRRFCSSDWRISRWWFLTWAYFCCYTFIGFV